MEAFLQEPICSAQFLGCVYLQAHQGLKHLLFGSGEGLDPIAH